VFFVSYANSRVHGALPDPNWRSVQFFDDLSEDVSELVSRPVGSDPGYMSRSVSDDVKLGPELREALGTCQVFVALLSLPYLRSPSCGMEWFAFSQRKTVDHAGQQLGDHTAIIPVVWAPLHNVGIPKIVDSIERFSPHNLPDSDIPAQYEKEGIAGLLQMRRDVAYRAVVWRLAQRIAEIHYSFRVEPQTVSAGELHDAFQEHYRE
jgi:hypothetical protein